MNSKNKGSSEQGQHVDGLIKSFGVPPSADVKAKLRKRLENEKAKFLQSEHLRKVSHRKKEL